MDSKDPIENIPDEMLGRTLGAYRIVRKIAEGGMGAVYEAVHIELGRRAAVKVLLRELLSSPESSNRFFNEAKAVSMVTHPSLVTIFEHGKSSDGEAYIVMEYLDGESLRHRQEKRYIGGTALNLLRQLASALAATHRKRIVHRDLKPENIMLVPDDGVADGERAKILDFGIAKLLPDGTQGEDKRLVKTRTGTLIGTPTYMSPEQCRASAPPDEKTDVYSLGVIGFEMLFGEPPFLSESAGELFAMHMFAPPPELKQRVPAVEPKLASLVQRLLDKTPANRPSMAELLTELQALPSTGLSDGPIDMRPSQILARGRKSGAIPIISAFDTSEQIRRGLRHSTGSITNSSRGEQVLSRRALPVALLGALMLLSISFLLWMLRPRAEMPLQERPLEAPHAAATGAANLVPPAAQSRRDGGVGTVSAAEDKAALPNGTAFAPQRPAASPHEGKRGKTTHGKRDARQDSQGSKDGKFQIDVWQ